MSTQEFEIFDGLRTKALKLYYRNEVIVVTSKIKKKRKILEKINLIDLKKNRW